MSRTDDGREFRLRPPKPRVTRHEGAAWSSGFKLLMHYARSSRKAGNRGAGGKGRGSRPYHQRCAVRVTYLRNKGRGHWKAHGRYLERESATLENEMQGVGFDQENGVDIARRLAGWQAAGDYQMWKLIISPEFGDRVDLSGLTRGVIERMEKDLGTRLEWAAVEHHNTEHPHVHVVVRGVRDDGEVLRMSREYVQRGIRAIAEDLCTRQLGYRTEIDAADAEHREISEKRFTSLDRRVLNDAHRTDRSIEPRHFVVIRNPVQAGLTEASRLRTKREVERLAVLRSMGLAQPDGPNRWRVRRDFDQILRAMQKAADRQRTLAAHGALMSDERLQIEVLDMRQLTSVEGRVLIHGEDEQNGRSYLMLEGTAGIVHFIHYTPEIEEVRSRGELRTNSFVRLRKRFNDGKPDVEITDFGGANDLLNNRRLLAEKARDLIDRGVIPTDDGWGGWLGKYQVALKDAVAEIDDDVIRQVPTPKRERSRDRSRGR